MDPASPNVLVDQVRRPLIAGDCPLSGQPQPPDTYISSLMISRTRQRIFAFVCFAALATDRPTLLVSLAKAIYYDVPSQESVVHLNADPVRSLDHGFVLSPRTFDQGQPRLCMLSVSSSFNPVLRAARRPRHDPSTALPHAPEAT